ncbi:MAG: OmpH family outer membrane protein [Paracoccaceae bacterium]
MPRLRSAPLAAALAAALALMGAVPPAGAQEQAEELIPRAPVLMLDRNRLFADSAFGKAAEARFQADSQILIAENLRLEQALEEEERALTDQRATLDADAFQKLAAEFDSKTEAIRAAQDAKSRSITSRREEDRQRFLQAAVPVLGELMRDAGAVAIFDKDMVILSLRGVDITEEAVARIDAALGDGSSLQEGEAPAPDEGAGGDAPVEATPPAAP